MMVDKENRKEFIRLSPSLKTRMKTIPNKIAFKIFSPDGERVGNLPSSTHLGVKHNYGKNETSSLDKQGHGVLKAKRRTLATLQPSANSKGKVVGVTRQEDELSTKKKTADTKPVIELSESTDTTEMARLAEPKKSDDTRETRQKSNSPDSIVLADDEHSTDSESCFDDDSTLVQDALKLVNYNPPAEKYWKDLAEQRRLALEEALIENEQLYDEVDDLKQNVADLEQALSEAKYFKLLYEKLLEEKEQDFNKKLDSAT